MSAPVNVTDGRAAREPGRNGHCGLEKTFLPTITMMIFKVARNPTLWLHNNGNVKMN